MKATSVVVNGERREIFKDPITDDGIKKSAKGLVKVDLVGNEYVLVDQASVEEEEQGELQIIYKDGAFLNEVILQDVRERINESV
jgi:nicotinamide phosphoribosyltransferase